MPCILSLALWKLSLSREERDGDVLEISRVQFYTFMEPPPHLDRKGEAKKGEILALSLLHVRRTSQKVHGSRHCVQSVRQALTIVPGHGDQGIVLP